MSAEVHFLKYPIPQETKNSDSSLKPNAENHWIIALMGRRKRSCGLEGKRFLALDCMALNGL